MSLRDDPPPTNQDLLEAAWGLIANVSHGDWKVQSEDWQQAAALWREQYHATMGQRVEPEAVHALRVISQVFERYHLSADQDIALRGVRMLLRRIDNKPVGDPHALAHVTHVKLVGPGY